MLFVPQFYQRIRSNEAKIHLTAARMADYMIRQDWLTNYQFIEGIDRSLKGVARRTSYASGLDTAIEDLERYYEQIAQHFQYFWPTLVDYINQIRTNLLIHL